MKTLPCNSILLKVLRKSKKEKDYQTMEDIVTILIARKQTTHLQLVNAYFITGDERLAFSDSKEFDNRK